MYVFRSTQQSECEVRSILARILKYVGGAGGGVQSTSLSNPAPILCMRHYCAIDCSVLACVYLFGNNY